MSGEADWAQQVQVMAAALLEVAPKFLALVHPAALDAVGKSAAFGISLSPAQLRLLQSGFCAAQVAMDLPVKSAAAPGAPVPAPGAGSALVDGVLDFQSALGRELDLIHRTLLEKNAAYGDSALNPLRVFGKGNPRDLLAARIDDKLSRLARGADVGEDTVLDLIGYLLLWRIAAALDRQVAMARGQVGEHLQA